MIKLYCFSAFHIYSTSASFSLKQIASTLKLRQFCGLVLPVLSEPSIGWTTSQNSFCLHGIDEFEWNLIWRVYNFTEKKFATSIIINTQGRVHNVILGNRMQYMKTTISTTHVLKSQLYYIFIKKNVSLNNYRFVI